MMCSKSRKWPRRYELQATALQIDASEGEGREKFSGIEGSQPKGEWRNVAWGPGVQKWIKSGSYNPGIS